MVSEVTGNVGLQFRSPIGNNGLEIFARADWQHLGETWWEPNNYSSRSAVDLLDLRAGVESTDNWAVTVWVKNATDEEYNTEYSPAPRGFYSGIPGPVIVSIFRPAQASDTASVKVVLIRI